ncbi:retinol dehydrogenase 7-like [Haemaphysalis longicornis]
MDSPRRQANTPMAVFVVVSLCTFVITAVTPPLQFAISVVGYLAFSLMIGFCIKRHLTARFGRRLPVTGKSVFITGCDTGLGNAMALALREKGFTVFAGCLDVTSVGARNLMSNGITTLHVDYVKHNTIVAAYDNIRDHLNGNALWGLVANAGVACFGETEWTQSRELQWAIDVNILGTYKFIMLGINQIKCSEGRVVIVTGLHGQPP